MTGWLLALAGIGALVVLARLLGRAGERQAETGDREVLLSLRHGGQAHGHDIVKSAMERTGGRVILGPSMLYGSLKRLLDRGLLEEVDPRPNPELDAEELRHFRLTPAGERAALEAARSPRRLLLARGFFRNVQSIVRQTAPGYRDRFRGSGSKVTQALQMSRLSLTWEFSL